jgi:N-6 DNA Methylase
MTSHEIEQNVKRMMENFSKENFFYDLLLAYGISKTSITRLRSGDFNLSKVDGEILYKKKIFFKQQPTEKLLSSIESLAKEERILKHSPRFAVVTDYKNLVAKDLKLGKNLDISIKDLPKYYGFFLPLANSEFNNYNNNDTEADRNAAYKMATLYDELVTKNLDIYNSRESIHNLNIFLSRLLFCFFAEDTEIFDVEGIFTDTLAQHTNENGSDTHLFLDRLFKRLNTENVEDFPDHLAKNFKYVNGGLFGGPKSDSPIFSQKARKLLLELGGLNWKKINPDIFGSMIQAVVIPKYRSDLGMHYTSVENIRKLIKPLFLDELEAEFEKSKTIPQLRKLINRIAKIKFFDPACGSGNFLIITYKEIRLLEIKILEKITELESNAPTIKWTSIQLSQFYGIELDDFAHEMAILSLWLAEHQMNKVFEEMLFDYGKSKPILPLKQAGKIVQGNAARVDWKTVCPIGKEDEVYVIGNPPYLGSRKQKTEQKDDLKLVFSHFKKYKDLDYISIWLYKSTNYIKGNNAKSAFVSTNSICQGEQVALLWPSIFASGIRIQIAYTSFKWTNNAKGNAGVTVIILGLANDGESKMPSLFIGNIKREVENINAYLIPSKSNIFVHQQNNSISKLPKINHGNMPAEDGKFLFDTAEKNTFLKKEPKAEKWFKKLVSAREYLNGRERWCLWLENITSKELNELTEVKRVVEDVRKIRLKSSRPQLAEVPHLFAQITQPENKNSIIIPRVSSENRDYLPIDFLDGSEYKVTDSFFTIATNEPYIFGIVSSRMHMVWTINIGGKLETRIQYSKTLCYNTFPFPNITLKQKENLNLYVFAILDERAKHPEKTMSQLYDPDKMPKGLKQAHEELDRAVEQCYRLQPFTSDTERLEFLFKLYEEMTKSGTLFEKQKKTRKTTAKAKK